MKQFTFLLVLLLGQIFYTQARNSSVSLHIKSKTSIASYEPEEFMTKVKTYPNPIDNYLIAEIPGEVNKISVFSLIGFKVMDVPTDGQEHVQINFDGLPSGYYILLFSAKNGQTLGTKKVVKR
jgi:hypothetical protein